MGKQVHLILFGLLISPALFAQRIENTAAFRQINSDHYLKIHFENDFFSHTDYYYSQGVAIEYVAPALKINPLNKLLIRQKNSELKYGIDLEINAFTPMDIVRKDILYGDRPFAATFTLKSFLISSNLEKRARMSSGLVLGVLGPAALGKEIQTGIHRWTDNYLPLGWPNQIRNDLVLNYNLNHEKLLFDVGSYLSMNTNAQLRVGTLSDKLQVGVTLMAGKFISPFVPNKPDTRRFQLYLYSQPLISVVAYDATMQGGIFNRNSPYTISGSGISRFTFENQTGIVFQLYRFHLEAFVNVLSKEFDTGKIHRWGGVKLGFEF